MLEARLGKATIQAQDIYRLGEEDRKCLICAHCSCTVHAVREHFKGEDGGCGAVTKRYRIGQGGPGDCGEIAA
ncbi:hypothetical protein GCM10010507_60660 [Streptomyces cinnamoneus]|uniref:Uncharacterized protein n=1 Tax=Streptomyces cinnamoneus TaxID=53446 RepID=A0A918WR65_STRCJ|nr:hypothetical protein GCM10010507_60660 [Streptomyces cinnamoneus]